MQPDEIANQLKTIFAQTLNVETDLIQDSTSYRGSAVKWDSVLHMLLIAEIERQFDIMLDTQDIIDMSDFAKAKAIVAKYCA